MTSKVASFVSDAAALDSLIRKFGGRTALHSACDVGRTTITRLANTSNSDEARTAKRIVFQDLATALDVPLHEIVAKTIEGTDERGNTIYEEYTEERDLEAMWPGLGGDGNLPDAFQGFIGLSRG